MITFSTHALYQIRLRGITQAEVRIALASPDKIIRQTAKRFRAIRKTNQKHLLIVIYDSDNGNTYIVTTFRTSKVSKYL